MTSAELPIHQGLDIIPAYESDPVRFFSVNEETKPTTMKLDSEPRWRTSEEQNSQPTTEVLRYADSAKNEVQQGRLRRTIGKLVVPATIAAVGFQQSPLNETFRANRTFEVLAETGSPLLAGLTTLGWTVPIEGVAGATISAGLLSQRDKIQPFLEKRIRKNTKDKLPDQGDLSETLHTSTESGVENNKKFSNKAGSFMVDAGITCSIGPGMVVAKRHIESADRTFKKDMETLFGFTALGAAVSGAIGYLATGGIEHAEKVGLESPAEWFAENAADWKFWTAALGIGYLTKAVHSKTKQLLRSKKK